MIGHGRRLRTLSSQSFLISLIHLPETTASSVKLQPSASTYLFPCYLRPTLRSPSSTVRLLPTHSYCESACDSMQTAILIHHFCPSVCLSVRHVVVRCLNIRMQKITVMVRASFYSFFPAPQPSARTLTTRLLLLKWSFISATVRQSYGPLIGSHR